VGLAIVGLMSESFRLMADLEGVVGGDRIISATIGPEGDACLLSVAPEDEHIALGRETGKGGATFPLSRAKSSYRARFIRCRETILQQTELSGIEQAFPTVQPLMNGEILLAGARCRFQDEDPEENGVVFDRNGRAVRRFILGDGIQDVQTTKEGMIWVSYFDEGVMGNFGWDEPIGVAGIVCFDADGKKQWDFKPPKDVDIILDCYAMNVADDAVWACYYTEFPVVRIDSSRRVRAWRNTVRGARAIAVSDQRVVLWGGYGEERTRCVVQEYTESEDDLTKMELIDLRFPIEVHSKAIRVTGRGKSLHAFVGAQWYSWTMR
jgi:hypothetical protein